MIDDPIPRPRRSGFTYSSSSSATGPAYQTFGRSVTRATPTAGAPARIATVASPASNPRNRSPRAGTPGDGVSNSQLKSCNRRATSSASPTPARRKAHGPGSILDNLQGDQITLLETHRAAAPVTGHRLATARRRRGVARGRPAPSPRRRRRTSPAPPRRRLGRPRRRPHRVGEPLANDRRGPREPNPGGP